MQTTHVLDKHLRANCQGAHQIETEIRLCICRSATEEEALQALEAFARRWGEKYPRIDKYFLNAYTIELTDDEKWAFYLAAYNGGEGTVKKSI